MPRPGVAPAAFVAALVLAAPARAHVIASPTFLASGAIEAIELSVPNEREAPMTTFVVRAPAGVEIERAEEVEGWSSAVDGQVATWSGGSLPAKLSETFGLRIRPTGALGAVELDAEQRYADGGKVRWPVALTIVPGSSESASASSAGSGKLVAVLVGVGLLVAGGVVLLAALRRSRASR